MSSKPFYEGANLSFDISPQAVTNFAILEEIRLLNNQFNKLLKIHEDICFVNHKLTEDNSFLCALIDQMDAKIKRHKCRKLKVKSKKSPK